jgi:gluconokinase
MVIVVMGPAGAGKSTVGRALAALIGCPFIDADDHHTASNVARMSRGEPLTDADRREWLARLRRLVARALDRREWLVIACSALTASHREQLAGGLRGVRSVYLRTTREVLAARLAARRGHFAGPALLDSQLATLEEPDDANALTVDAANDVETIVGHIRLELGL